MSQICQKRFLETYSERCHGQGFEDYLPVEDSFTFLVVGSRLLLHV